MSRQRRSEARRSIASILDSAREVLAEDPRATLTEIAERSGVHRTTLHRHFASREALIEELAADAARAFDVEIAATDLEHGDAREAARRATLAFVRETGGWRVARYAPLGALPRSDSAESFRARMLALLERGQREGSIRTDTPAVDLYFAWLGLVITWGVFRGDERAEPEAIADAIVRILLPEPQPVVIRVMQDAGALRFQADGDVQVQWQSG